MKRLSIDLGSSRILITGAHGFLGKFVVRAFLENGAHKKNLRLPRSTECDLRIRENCVQTTYGVDLVIHLAGNVGGIGKNRELPGTLFYDNAVMGIQLIEAARNNGVKKFVCIGTICAYPKFTPTPFAEENLWAGYPEETNAPYGLAKKILLVQLHAYREEFGFNGIYLLPVNLYGPGDNFDPHDSHVIPALIRKIVEAKKRKASSIQVWGDGTPTREFLYVEDAARGIVLATQRYDKSEPVNLGSGFEISIKDLVGKIAKILKFEGKTYFDASQPNGQPRRVLDVSRAHKEFGFIAQTPFEHGLRRTISWYLRTYYDNRQ